MPEGHEVVFEGEGDESPDWEAGDVVLRVRSTKQTGGWRRKESSLYWKETIGIDEVSEISCGNRKLIRIVIGIRCSFPKALLGFERNLTHLDGHVVHLRRTGVTQPGGYHVPFVHVHIFILTSLPRLCANNQRGRDARL